MSETQINNPESGLRDRRIEFVREDDFGVTPEDAEFLKYSDTVSEVTWSSDALNEERRGLGSADVQEFMRGPESHEVSISYDLVKWFEDGGNPNDASYDGLFRNEDNLLENSHTFVERENKGSILAKNTVSGNASYATRIYTVGRGGLIDEATITGDPSDSQPLTVELSYSFQKVRSYQIDQPDEATHLYVVVDNNDDNSQILTIEGEDDQGDYSVETVNLDGTELLSTSTEFETIDAAFLDERTEGNVTIGINDGDEESPTEGDELMYIYGSDEYDGTVGDLGVPGRGEEGSREELTDTEPLTFLGDTIERGGDPVPYEIQSMTINVSNNVEEQERTDALGMALFPGERNLTGEATMYGESASHQLLNDHLQNRHRDIEWYMDDGTLVLEDAVLTDPGDRAAEEGQAIMTVDNTFTATGFQIN